MFAKPSRLRSARHRRHVAALACVCCGRDGLSQCAHANFGKGFALKACDSQTFPLCPGCHRQHDTGGMPRAERWKREWEYADATRALLIQCGQWSPEIEQHYQRAIAPLARVVHGEGNV